MHLRYCHCDITSTSFQGNIATEHSLFVLVLVHELGDQEDRDRRWLLLVRELGDQEGRDRRWLAIQEDTQSYQSFQ